MEKQFATYEQSLALKELGFDEPCISFYNMNDDNKLAINAQFDSYNINTNRNSIPIKSSYTGSLKTVSAPLKQQVFEWFIEKHDLFGKTQPYISDVEPFNLVWEFVILDLNWGEDKDIHLNTRCSFVSPKEAESACIDKLIEICKNK